MPKPLSDSRRSRETPFRQFSSELLLQQAIAGLLRRTPGIAGVQILQGNDELGKDLVFRIRGGFGEPLLCACVVKNTRITGEVGKSAGARTVLLQIEQAFDSPHLDGAGKDISVERVYVITPYEIPVVALRSIAGRLKQRQGQVIFLGGSQLFDLFKEFWPDFLAEEADLLELHLKTTKEDFQDDKALQAVAAQYNLGNFDGNSKRVYVPQLLHRTVFAYNRSRALEETLPGEVRLTQEWNQRDVELLSQRIKRLKEVMSTLANWGFVQNLKWYVEPKGKTALEEFVASLEAALRAAWHHAGMPFVESDKSFKLKRPEDLITRSQKLSEKIHSDLLEFDRQLDTARRVVESTSLSGLQALLDPAFLRSCVIDDFAKVAPQNLLARVGERTIEFSSDLLGHFLGRALLVVGAPGYGKTSFCRWNALNDAQNFSAEDGDILPIYVPLQRLRIGRLGSFEEVFLGRLGQSVLLTDPRTRTRRWRRVRLYLDGLDEISDEERRREIVELVRAKCATTDEFQVVLTTRDYLSALWLDWLPRVSLSGLGEEQIKELAAKWLGEPVRFYKELRRAEPLRELMTTPLLATLIILVFRQTGRLPESRIRLYDIFVDLLSEGWDLAKGLLKGSSFYPQDKLRVLRRLAANLHTRGLRTFGRREINRSIKSMMPRWINHADLVREELLRDGLICQTGTVLQFSHLSFQEFLAAKDFLCEPTSKRISLAVLAFLRGSDWWRGVVQFYIAMSGSPREVGIWLRTLKSKHIPGTGDRQGRDLSEMFSEAYPGSPVEEFLPRDV
jgi:hypothetical protein